MSAEPAQSSAPNPAAAARERERDLERRMPLLGHLAELRTRLRNIAIAVVLGTIVCYAIRIQLFAILVNPFFDAWARGQHDGYLGKAELVFLSPHEAFTVLFKLSLLAGVVLSSPFIFREIWKFIAPGLYERERRYGLLFVVLSVTLFVGGACFAYLYVLPAGYRFFLGYAANDWGRIQDVMGHAFKLRLSEPFTVRPMITMDEISGLTLTLLLVFGLVFELPLVLGVMAMMGIVSAGQLWRFNRYAIVIFAVLGAVLTPGDMVFGQLAMTGALTVLYNLSIVVALFVQRKRAAEATALAKVEST